MLEGRPEGNAERDDLDRELAGRTLAGDDDAFAQLVRRYMRTVRAVAWHVAAVPEQDLDDICQETFLRAYRGLATYRAEASFRSWLLKVAANVALTWRAKRGRQATRMSPDPPPEASDDKAASGGQPEHAALQRALAVRVREAIGDLAPAYRLTVALRYYGEMSYAEIAETLSCPIGTVMSRLSAARAILKRTLADDLTDPGGDD